MRRLGSSRPVLQLPSQSRVPAQLVDPFPPQHRHQRPILIQLQAPPQLQLPRQHRRRRDALNLSTRLIVQAGDAVGIGGFIITGTAPKHLLLRGLGPSLCNAGLTNCLADPVLELQGAPGFPAIVNDNWRDPCTGCVGGCNLIASGIAPTNDLEAAICTTLDPGAYTVILRGNGNATGVGLVEVYDLDQPPVDSKLANLSTRAFVNTGSDIVIAGFLLGSSGGTDKIVVRGLGPSLASAGLSNTLADPTLDLRDSNGTLLTTNDNWKNDPAQAAQLMAVGLAPTNALESGIVSNLPPGAYTALLGGVNNGTGLGLIEVYDLGSP